MADQYEIHQIQGANVWADDGERLGLVGEVHLDRKTGEPAFITVALGLFESRQYFVPLAGARRDGQDNIYVAFSKQAVKDSPELNPDGPLTADEEKELADYYARA